MRTLFSVLLLCGLHCSTRADYLIVSRSATIKAQPDASAEIIDRVQEEEVLLLLEETQSPNGYFKVKHPYHNTVGWVYRTLVRRYEGDPPGFQIDFDPTAEEDLVVHVLDVGPGLCTVIRFPDGKYIIYDLGHWRGAGMSVYTQIASIIPIGSPIELVVLSHTDSDHIGGAALILQNYRVKKLLHTGYEKSMITPVNDQPTGTYQRMVNAINALPYPLEEINLHANDSTIAPGTTFNFGNGRVVFLCGFGKPLDEWGLGATDYSKRINAVSIVMRLEYAGRSILFGGDAVGRFDDGPSGDLQATEKYLIEKATPWLNSDILIAPHHGADNGSSTSIIEATSPEYVIFSAGHDHEHPRQTTADRYLTFGINAQNIFRTDRGDDERKPDRPDKEWVEGRVDGCQDSYGDDNVFIAIAPNGAIRVRYQNPDELCFEEILE